MQKLDIQTTNYETAQHAFNSMLYEIYNAARHDRPLKNFKTNYFKKLSPKISELKNVS